MREFDCRQKFSEPRKIKFLEPRKNNFSCDFQEEEEETFSAPPKKQEENFFVSSIGCNDIYSCW